MNALSLLARIAAGRTDLTIDLLDETEQPLLLVVDGGSLLQWCAYYGDVTAVRTLLGHGASLEDLGPDKGLNAAAFHGHWQLCQFLLESGASATRVDPGTGETALHSSLTNEDRTRYDLVVSLLLAANADVNAATLPRAPTGSFMRDCRTRGETPLHRAAAFGTTATVQMLLDAGADPARQDSHGETALAWASWYRRPVEVLRLLCYGSHIIHPAYTPLKTSLLGSPLNETAP
jgi:ankyrin repeat protein